MPASEPCAALVASLAALAAKQFDTPPQGITTGAEAALWMDDREGMPPGVFNTACFQQVAGGIGDQIAESVLESCPRVVRLYGGSHWYLLPGSLERHQGYKSWGLGRGLGTWPSLVDDQVPPVPPNAPPEYGYTFWVEPDPADEAHDRQAAAEARAVIDHIGRADAPREKASGDTVTTTAPAPALPKRTCSACSRLIHPKNTDGRCAGCRVIAKRAASGKAAARTVARQEEAVAASQSAAAVIRDGRKAFGPAGFDVHKRSGEGGEAVEFAAVARATAPAEGWEAYLRVYQRGSGEWVEAPLQPHGAERPGGH